MKKTYLFTGDSITGSNRLADYRNNSLGDGFVHMIADHLSSLSADINIVNKAHDGFTIQKLRRNWYADCIKFRPDLITVLVGINDLGISMNTGIPLNVSGYYNTFEELILAAYHHTDARLIILEPFIFPYPEEYKLWRPGLIKMKCALRLLTEKYRAVLIPLDHKLQLSAEKYGYCQITTDGIHLTSEGHKIIMEEWLKIYNSMI